MNFPRHKWKVNSSLTIELITPAEFASLPNGTELICMDGSKSIKGRDYINDDIRYGFLAFGFPDFNSFIKEGLKTINKKEKL